MSRLPRHRVGTIFEIETCRGPALVRWDREDGDLVLRRAPIQTRYTGAERYGRVLCHSTSGSSWESERWKLAGERGSSSLHDDIIEAQDALVAAVADDVFDPIPADVPDEMFTGLGTLDPYDAHGAASHASEAAWTALDRLTRGLNRYTKAAREFVSAPHHLRATSRTWRRCDFQLDEATDVLDAELRDLAGSHFPPRAHPAHLRLSILRTAAQTARASFDNNAKPKLAAAAHGLGRDERQAIASDWFNGIYTATRFVALTA